MKNFLFCSFLLVTLLISGCGHTPVRTNTMPMAVPPETAAPAEAALRAAEFKKATAALSIRGIAVFPSAFIGRFTNDQVIGMIKNLGFNRIYCCLTSEQELDSELAEFISAASANGIPVELVLSQQDFYRAYRGNRLIRGLFIQYPDLYAAVRKAVKFIQNDLPENVKVAGITVQLAPHLINGNNIQRTHQQLYSWSEKHYGIGGDNDMLMRQSLQYAAKIAAIPELPPLTIAVPDFYHRVAAEGKISCGKIRDFAKFAPSVAVVNSANLPSKLPVMVQDALDAAPKGCKILIVVPLAGHTSVESARLRRRNWKDFQNSTAYLVKKTGSHPACAGVIFSPLAVIEYLRLEK